MIDDLSRRIDALEIRSMEQEVLIDDLNATITSQWRVIDALKREIERLGERVDSAAAAPNSSENELPPHY